VAIYGKFRLHAVSVPFEIATSGCALLAMTALVGTAFYACHCETCAASRGNLWEDPSARRVGTLMRLPRRAAPSSQ